LYFARDEKGEREKKTKKDRIGILEKRGENNGENNLYCTR
jgi:hypothetical protein